MLKTIAGILSVQEGEITVNGQIVSKEALYECVWGRPLAGDSTALYTAVSRLNAKLAEENAQVTISYFRGRGYALEAV